MLMYLIALSENCIYYPSTDILNDVVYCIYCSIIALKIGFDEKGSWNSDPGPQLFRVDAVAVAVCMRKNYDKKAI